MNLENFFTSLSDEQKKQLANALLSSIDNKVEPPVKKIKPKNTKKKQQDENKSITIDDNFTVIKSESKDPQNRRKEPVRARKNEWKDTGEFRDANSPDYDHTPTPRRREPPKKVDVECHVCGRSFKMEQRFVFGEYYRCNKCIGR